LIGRPEIQFKIRTSAFGSLRRDKFHSDYADFTKREWVKGVVTAPAVCGAGKVGTMGGKSASPE
jgi:hypothetical protein